MPFLSYSLFPSGRFLREASIMCSAHCISGIRRGGSCYIRTSAALWVPKVKVTNSHFGGQIVAFCCKDLWLWGGE